MVHEGCFHLISVARVETSRYRLAGSLEGGQVVWRTPRHLRSRSCGVEGSSQSRGKDLRVLQHGPPSPERHGDREARRSHVRACRRHGRKDAALRASYPADRACRRSSLTLARQARRTDRPGRCGCDSDRRADALRVAADHPPWLVREQLNLRSLTPQVIRTSRRHRPGRRPEMLQ